FPTCLMVPMEGVEPTHSHEYQILSLARLPIPPHRLIDYQRLRQKSLGNLTFATEIATEWPDGTSGNPTQASSRFAFTPVQIHQGAGQPQAPSAWPVAAQRALLRQNHRRGRGTFAGEMF